MFLPVYGFPLRLLVLLVILSWFVFVDTHYRNELSYAHHICTSHSLLTHCKHI
jgi:hypothetical protein